MQISHRPLWTGSASIAGVIALQFVARAQQAEFFYKFAGMIEYEAMGLGKLPIDPSGGLKAKGHSIGATGVSMHDMSCMQLMNETGDMQIEDAALAGAFNMGGAAVSNYVSILERLR